MAVFGVPVAHEDDPERAVRAALDVRDHVRTLNAGRTGIRLPEVHAGINSGEVMVAPSQEAAGFAVIGDTVNTAARLGDLATAGHVLVDPTTRERTRRAIRYGQRRERAVKNKAEPLVTFEALGVARRSPSLPRGAFVDREDMLALLGRELELVEHEGRSRVLVVTGEPGIGKSRLAQELERSLPHHRLLFGRCAPFGDRRGLSALADAVAAAVGVGAAGVSDAATRQAIDRAARRIARGQHPAALAADLRTLLAVEDDASRSERDAARAARLVLEDVARTGARRRRARRPPVGRRIAGRGARRRPSRAVADADPAARTVAGTGLACAHRTAARSRPRVDAFAGRDAPRGRRRGRRSSACRSPAPTGTRCSSRRWSACGSRRARPRSRRRSAC